MKFLQKYTNNNNNFIGIYENPLFFKILDNYIFNNIIIPFYSVFKDNDFISLYQVYFNYPDEEFTTECFFLSYSYNNQKDSNCIHYINKILPSFEILNLKINSNLSQKISDINLPNYILLESKLKNLTIDTINIEFVNDLYILYKDIKPYSNKVVFKSINTVKNTIDKLTFYSKLVEEKPNKYKLYIYLHNLDNSYTSPDLFIKSNKEYILKQFNKNKDLILENLILNSYNYYIMENNKKCYISNKENFTILNYI